MRTPDETIDLPCTPEDPRKGVIHRYWFPNGYGASVARHTYSYGHEYGLWVLVVIQRDPAYPEDFKIVYDAPVAGGIRPGLTLEEVDEVLAQIEALPTPTPTPTTKDTP